MHLCVYMPFAISPPHLAPLTAWQDLALGGRWREGWRRERDRWRRKRGWRVKASERRGVWGQRCGTQQVSGLEGGSDGGQNEMRIAGGLSVFSCSSVFHLLTQLWLAGWLTDLPTSQACQNNNKETQSPTSSISCFRFALTQSKNYVFLEMAVISDDMI